MIIQKIPIDYSYKKNNGTWVLHLSKDLLPNNFDMQEQSLINIPPGATGGNHKHPRVELFISTSNDLMLYWIEDEQTKHEQMLQGEQLYLYVIPPFLPHALKNIGSQSAILYEFANAPQYGVEVVEII